MNRKGLNQRRNNLSCGCGTGMQHRSVHRPAPVFFLCLLMGLGCIGTAAEDDIGSSHPQRRSTRTLRHDGIDRTYHICLPREFKKTASHPLVLVLHGGGGQGRTFDRGTTKGTLSAAADTRGMILVFPEGIKKRWEDGRAETQKKVVTDDVGFISTLIDTMVKDFGADAERVYATGISNGGFMSLRLAMDLSGKIAAVAPVTAQLSKALTGRTPEFPISIMIVNGTHDPLVPYDGGHVRLLKFGRSRGEILSTAATVDYFRRHNTCEKTPETIKLPDTDPNDGIRVEIEKYTGGRDGTEVILVKVVGGGHTWPGGTQYLGQKTIGPVSRDINASDMILDFFLSHSRKQ